MSVETKTKNWYIVHTYSGFEERVRQNLKQRIEAMGMAEAFGEIRIPTETLVEMKGKESAGRSSASSSRATSSSRWRCPTTPGTWSRTRRR